MICYRDALNYIIILSNLSWHRPYLILIVSICFNWLSKKTVPHMYIQTRVVLRERKKKKTDKKIHENHPLSCILFWIYNCVMFWNLYSIYHSVNIWWCVYYTNPSKTNFTKFIGKSLWIHSTTPNKLKKKIIMGGGGD